MLEKNKNVSPSEKNYVDLLYMTPNHISARDLAVLLQNEKEIEVQLWEEMNILELELPNQTSVDFEPLDIKFKDPSDAAFVNSNNIKSIYAINFCESELDTVTSLFLRIIEKYSGFLCADTKDFLPIYAGSLNNEINKI